MVGLRACYRGKHFFSQFFSLLKNFPLFFEQTMNFFIMYLPNLNYNDQISELGLPVTRT